MSKAAKTRNENALQGLTCDLYKSFGRTEKRTFVCSYQLLFTRIFRLSLSLLSPFSSLILFPACGDYGRVFSVDNTISNEIKWKQLQFIIKVVFRFLYANGSSLEADYIDVNFLSEARIFLPLQILCHTTYRYTNTRTYTQMLINATQGNAKRKRCQKNKANK